MGRYVIEGLLGPGGVTETYLAQLPDEPGEASGGPRQLFALKLLRQDRVPEGVFPEAARRFAAAGRQLVGFHRPGLGKVVEVSDDPAATFIVTEHVAGHDLARMMEMGQAEVPGRAGVDPALAGLLGAEIARLLYVGHAAKPSLFHLGLAPQNVTVTDEGEVVLLDAGIAAPLRGITEQSPERWWFVAPELVGKDVGAVALNERQGVAADLYSLGALLCFLVTGQPPAPSTPPEISGVAAKLGAAIRSLLQPVPEDRPESAAVLVEWLSGGAESTRERQRLIAEGLRKAETEAREAAVAAARQAGRGTPVPPATKVFFTLVPPSSQAPFLAGMSTEHGATGQPSGARGRSGLAKMLLAGGLVVAAGAGAFSLLAGQVGRPTSLAPVSGSGDEPKGQAEAAGARLAGPPSDAERAASEMSARERVLSRIAGHLIAETVPPGATVWVDGVVKGRTFADVVVGPGIHRVVLTLPGHRMFRDEVDTGGGAIIRRNLVPVPPPARGSGFIRVECQTVGKYPILVDDEESGFLCPSLKLPVAIGKHTVGIFVPTVRRVVSVEITVEPGARPALAKFSE